MATLLLLTASLSASSEVMPALGLLSHSVRVMPPEPTAFIDAPSVDVVMVDGRRDLAGARSLCRLIRTTGITNPLLLITTDGGLIGVAVDWGFDDVILDTAGPAELDARIRLSIARVSTEDETEIRNGDVVIDENAYSARVRGRSLDLTFKEFELLRFLAQHPGRVFSRAQLLQEVWGYDYFGGTRTVDVHVRRLRAKLGAEHEALIGTVRNVGYRFVPQRTDNATRDILESESADANPAPAQ
jgi:DNA-binding response OmpR family regulator